MKKITVFIAILLLFAIYGLCAQQVKKMTPEQAAKQKVGVMTKELNLNGQQQKDLIVFYTELIQKKRETFEKNKEDHETMIEGLDKSWEEEEAFLKKKLTAEQHKTYRENQEKRQQEQLNKGR